MCFALLITRKCIRSSALTLILLFPLRLLEHELNRKLYFLKSAVVRSNR